MGLVLAAVYSALYLKRRAIEWDTKDEKIHRVGRELAAIKARLGLK